MLEIGTKAPEFTLPDQNGKIILSTCNYKTDVFGILLQIILF